MQLLTDRLVIRPLEEADFPAFAQTLNEVQRACLGGAKAFFNWIVAQYAAMDIVNSLISLGVFARDTGTLLGTAGAGRHDDLHEPEIFYYLLPEFRGHGYATEAAGAITKWALARDDVSYLIGTVAVDNPASQNVLARCGYRFVDERTLLVHAEGKRYRFRYYRYDPAP